MFSLLLRLTLFSQSYIAQREVVNYNKHQYNAGTQNWNIKQDDQGRLYFANNEGVLVFDGTYWKLYPLPNKTIVRSIVFGRDHRLYVGGQDEIGYFSPDKSGKLTYTSLNELIPEKERNFSDIWNIVSFGDDIFFRSTNKVFRYSNHTISINHPYSSWLFLGVLNDTLIVHDEQKGILYYENGIWKPFIEKQYLPPGFFITSITAFAPDSGLITTGKNGIFLVAGKQLRPFLLKGNTIDNTQNFSGSVTIDAEHFGISTYTNGIFIVDKKGQVLENISLKEGLQNSNIRSLFMDRDKNIWMGLDNGIDFVAYNNAIKQLNPAIFNGGGGYSLIQYRNSLYFALSNGIYETALPASRDLSYTPNNIRLLNGGQTWGLNNINNNLLVARDDGFYRIANNEMQTISAETGYWVFQSLPSPPEQKLIAAGNYNGVRIFEQVGNNQIIDKGILSTLTGSTRFLEIDGANIWVSHPYRGVYKINRANAAVKLYTHAEGLPSDLNNHVYKLKGRIVIATEKGVYEYDSLKDRFLPSDFYKPIFGETSLRYLKEGPQGNIWFVHEKTPGIVDFSTAKPSVFYLPELKGRILSGFEYIYPVDENNVFIGGETGFYHINYQKYKENIHPLSTYIRTVKSISSTDSLLFGGYANNTGSDNRAKEDIPAVSYRWNSFHFEYSSPLFEQQLNIEYSYLLKGFDEEWSEWTKKTEKDYTNLPAGNYTFSVKARNNLNNESTVSSYSFTVLPPWYQSWWARLFYLALAILLIFIAYKWQERKHLKREAIRFAEERKKYEDEQKRITYQHQLELEKSEKELIRVQNEKLETEIEFKNSELASTAMNLVQKKEFILKVKQELQHFIRSGKEKIETNELKKVVHILSDEEKLNEEWEQFSLHFNKVHGDFLIILKEKFPDLKPHELKLCAYLRMNLSSKEIAQLMSISVRGVEISRYRLRKKLQIPTEVNLFQFLFDLQTGSAPANPENNEPGAGEV